jgi:ATP-dependent Lon protease
MKNSELTNLPFDWQIDHPMHESYVPWIDFNAVEEEITFVEKAALTQDGDAALKALLSRVMRGSNVKRHVLPPSLCSIKNLRQQFPNFCPVVDFVLGELALSMSSSALPRRITPALLLGDPGIGKTLFAKSLASTLGVPSHFVSMNTSTSGFALSGLDRGWGTARQGEVFNSLLRQNCINPLFILDEVDKANTDAKSDPLGPLYQLLEVETAKSFIDEFARVPIDASLISWVITANDECGIPGALLSRMRVFHIPRPSELQMRQVVQNQYRRMRESYPALANELHSDLIETLSRLSPRGAQLHMQEAAGRAALRAVEGRNGLVRLKQQDVAETQTVKRTMGFTG